MLLSVCWTLIRDANVVRSDSRWEISLYEVQLISALIYQNVF